MALIYSKAINKIIRDYFVDFVTYNYILITSTIAAVCRQIFAIFETTVRNLDCMQLVDIAVYNHETIAVYVRSCLDYFSLCLKMMFNKGFVVCDIDEN